MRRGTTLRRYGVRGPMAALHLVQLSVVASCVVFGCAPPTRYEQPSAVRGYEILITRRDSLGQGIAEGLRRRGFTVRRYVRGGSRPTADLLTFTVREPEPAAGTPLHVRLADTRTRAIAGAGSAPR